MFRSPLTYSRLVTLLKVILPLTALALLSTLFLFSRDRTPQLSLPFIDLELQARIREQQITAPYFVGSIENGLSLTLTADAARPDPDNLGSLISENVMAEVRTAQDMLVVMFGQSGVVDTGANLVQLSGGVSVTNSTKYNFNTDQLRAALDSLNIESVGEVTGDGPIGSFRAGKFTLTSSDHDNSLHLLFTNGVILTFDPTGTGDTR